ncbi:MAG: Ig-like domain-containing protein [Gemmatimonadaceae bacterium]|nr:Ig-like domain-containing protein [Gemmatimonadaceae bacterium]
MRRYIAMALVVVLAACGGGGDAGPVTPTPVPVASVTISGGVSTLVVQQTTQLTATAQNAAGSALSGRTITWTATPSTVATVDGTGTVTGVGAGSATITATSEGKSATTTVTVRDGAMIGASGGTVVASGGRTRITFPSGALSLSTPITVSPFTLTTQSPVAPGSAFEFGPSGLTFAKPATIAMTYDPATLPAGANASDLRVYLVSANGWLETDSGSVDVATRTVTGQTTHFSRYATCLRPCQPEAGRVTVDVDSALFTLRPGASASSHARVIGYYYSGSTVALTFEGVPTGMTVTSDFDGAVRYDSYTERDFRVSVTTLPTLAGGIYPITARVRGTNVPSETFRFAVTVVPIGFSMTANPTSVSLPVGGSAGAELTFSRDGLTAPITLSAVGLPPGVTASFAPASPTGNSSTMTLSASASAAPGNFNTVIVRATTAGAPTVDITLPVTVTAGNGFTLAGTPALLSLTPNSSATTGVRATRSGTFTGAIAYSVSGVPAGMTATITPTAVSDSMRLMVTASAIAAQGTYPLVVTGTSGNITERVTIVATVGAPGTSVVQIDLTACAASGTNVLWVAVQDGAGAFTRVNGTAGVYSFSLSNARGAVAIVYRTSALTTTLVEYSTPSEMAKISVCDPDPNGTKRVNLATNPLLLNESTYTTLGGAATYIDNPETTGQLLGVREGPRDLISWLVDNATGTFKRGIIRRDQNIGNNATAPVLNFTGADSFTPVTGVMSAANGGASFFMFLGYYTGPACRDYGGMGRLYGAATATVAGVPSGVQRASDLHELIVQSPAGFETPNVRYAGRLFHTMSNQSVTLGAELSAPNVSSVAGPYKRVQTTFVLPNDYDFAGYSYEQAGKRLDLFGTVNYFGGRSMTLTTPDLSGVAGFDSAWAPPTTGTGTTEFNAGIDRSCADGATWRNARIRGTY